MSNLKFYIGSSNGRHFEARVVNIAIDFENKNVQLLCKCYDITGIGGTRVITEINTAYGRRLIANNSTLVHPQTGQYWNDIPEGEKPEGVEPVGEWDYFKYLSDNVPVKITAFVQNVLKKNRARLAPYGFVLDTA